MRPYLNALLATVLATSLSACTSTDSNNSLPAERYYYLNNTPKATHAQRLLNNVPKVQLRLVHVPEYLKQNKLVMQRGDYELIYANYHLWSEVPAISLFQSLLEDLNNLQTHYYLTNSCQDCKSIALSISRFHSSMDGDVILSGSYQISNKESQLQLQKSFNFSEELDKGGYDEMVKTMRLLTAKLAADIKLTLNQ